MPQDPIVVGGRSVQAGQRATVDLSIARLYTHTELTIPVHVIHGKQPGPRLFVCAAIHGDEVLGVEVIRRLLQVKTLDRLRGSLLAVPVVNVFGFVGQSRYSPDRRDLNRFFPGKVGGSLTSRMARLFMEEIVEKCSHGIDLHTGSNHRANLPQVRAYLDDPETVRLAQAFGAPIILDADPLEGSLRQAVKDKGIQVLLYEAGEVLRFDEVAIRVGLNGVLNVMRAIGMFPPRRRKTPFEPVIARSSTWVRAPISGIVRPCVRLGDRVAEGQTVAEIADPFGEREELAKATATGLAIGALRLPLVHKGDAILHIARLEQGSGAGAVMQAFHQEFEPE